MRLSKDTPQLFYSLGPISLTTPPALSIPEVETTPLPSELPMVDKVASLESNKTQLLCAL